MHPIEACIQNPVKVAVGVLLFCLFGLVALFSMPMQLTPEVNKPTITVETKWRGASPEEIEQEIIVEQEEYLKSVEGVTKMTSESTDSAGTITLEFGVGADMQEALLKVSSNLQQVPEYPEDADEPIIKASSANDQAIAWFIVSPRMPDDEAIEAVRSAHPETAEELGEVLSTSNNGLAMLRLKRVAKKHEAARVLLPSELNISTMRKFIEDNVEPEFERVDGVSNSSVFGGQDPEMQVIVDPEKLAARGLTVLDVRAVLRGQNKDTSGGDIWEGKRRYVVRTLGQFKSETEVEKQLLAMRDGRPVYIGDVAEVKLGYTKPDSFVRRFGDFALAVNCQRETGANVLDVMEGLRATSVRLNEGLLKEHKLEMNQVYDETDYIYSAVGLVNQNIILGGALTILVLMTFLHLGYRTLVIAPFILLTALAAMYVSPWLFVVTLALILAAGFWYARGAVVVGLAIPVSIIGTFLCLHAMGRSLNVISLAGLSFAVGMLVDNAVVVLENIYRHYQQGEPPFRAAFKAGREVWGAVLASTATTLAVFLPVIFMQEEAGQLFRDIALAISFAVGLSLIVSITVIPTVAARMLRRRKTGEPERERSSAQPAFADRFAGIIVGINAWIIARYWRRVAVVVLLVGAAIAFTFALRPKIEYLPNGNRNLVICLVLPPPGYNVDELMVLGQEVENALEPYWNVDPDSPEAAELDYPAVADFFYVARGRQVFLGLRSAEPTRVGELIGLIQSKFRPKTEEEIVELKKQGIEAPHLPGAFVVAFQSSLFERGLQGGRAIDVEISGPELNELIRLGRLVMAGQKPNAGDEETAELVGVAQTIPNAQMQPVPSLDISSPEIRITPRLEEAAGMGVSTADLGYTIDALIDGAYAADYYLAGNDKIDLVIIGSDKNVSYTQHIARMPVSTPAGNVVPVSALADVTLAGGPEQINHRERVRTITIRVTPPPNISLEESIERIENVIIPQLKLKPGYRINLSGAANKLVETWNALWVNLLLALLITYLLMAALFESWVYPLVIILTVPLGVVGGIAGLRMLSLYQAMLAGVQGIPIPPAQSLDVLTMLGFVILIGTVVNNAILIVHQSLIYIREEGYAPQDAVLESVRTRIRPIFMTTTTTVFGLAPLVLFPGAGSELYAGLGSVVLGGLLVSTVFTLFLVPTIFSLSFDMVSFFYGHPAADEPQGIDRDHPTEEVEARSETAAVIESVDTTNHGVPAGVSATEASDVNRKTSPAGETAEEAAARRRPR